MSTTAEALFERHFLPLYPKDAARDLALARRTDANPAGNPQILAELDAIAEVFAKMAPAAFGEDPVLDFTDASVKRLAILLDKERRDAWIAAKSDPEGPSLFVNVVLHGAVYVGATIVRTRGAKWLVRRPLWESMVRLDSSAGTADLSPFSWFLKALSDDEIGQSRLLDRYRTHVEIPTFDPTSLAPIVAMDPASGPRKIPRLAKVRYDLLYKHLKAHLPEIKDVGADFPSPERFDAYKFESLSFELLGEGRMLLLWGPTKEGVHLFWLDASGFQKAVFVPSDSFPAPVVKAIDGKIQIVAQVAGKMTTVEMLWWGA